MPTTLQEPWLSFLTEVDGFLPAPATVHSLGGFVLRMLWGLPRETGDLDFIDIDPASATNDLLRIAGQGSALANRFHLAFQHVAIAEYPEDYRSRLVDITPRRFHRLQLLALEVHDLVLAKIARFAPHDRDDIEFLASKGALDRSLLRRRYEEEMRPYLLNEARYAVNLHICLEALFDETGP